MANAQIDTNQIWDLYEKGLTLIPLGRVGEQPPAYFIERCESLQDAIDKWPKTPRISWKQYQSRESAEQEVEHWLKMFPGCNFAIVTGPKIVVVDADSAEAEQWVWDNITRTPWTVKTGKGRHFYYQTNHKVEIRNTVKQKLKVDIRGHGGYVVAPGSIHPSGAVYEWDINPDFPVDSVADLPMLSNEDVQKIHQTAPQGTIGGPLGNLQGFVPSDAPASGAPVEKGGRNNAAASLVGQYIRQGHSLQQIKGLLDNWNGANAEPLSSNELNTTIASVVQTHNNNHPDQPVVIEKPRLDPSSLLIRADQLSYSPTKWLLKYLLPQGAIGSVFGQSGGGKSFSALDFGLCIATDRDWFDHKLKQSGPVIYVCGEGQDGIAKRMTAWSKHHGISLEGVPFYVTKAPVLFLEDDHVEGLLSAINAVTDEHGAPVLIIIDTLNRNFGAGDENSTKDMTRFINALTQVNKTLGCSICVVHHTGKDAEKGARGSSALRAAMDFEISLRVTSDEDADLQTFELAGTKMKDSRKTKSSHYRLSVIELGVDDDGDIESSCVVERLHEEGIQAIEAMTAKGKRPRLGAVQKRILNTIKSLKKTIEKNNPAIEKPKTDRPHLVNLLKEKAQIPPNGTADAINTAIDKGWLTECDPGWFELTVSD